MQCHRIWYTTGKQGVGHLLSDRSCLYFSSKYKIFSFVFTSGMEKTSYFNTRLHLKWTYCTTSMYFLNFRTIVFFFLLHNLSMRLPMHLSQFLVNFIHYITFPSYTQRRIYLKGDLRTIGLQPLRELSSENVEWGILRLDYFEIRSIWQKRIHMTSAQYCT